MGRGPKLAGALTRRVWRVRACVQVQAEITESLSDVSAVVFFLIGAMTIVECVDQHQVRAGGGVCALLRHVSVECTISPPPPPSQSVPRPLNVPTPVHMTISHAHRPPQGFKLITDVVRVRSKASLLWLSAWIAFFMSSVLDNLTTCIVMISLLQKICPDTGAPDHRLRPACVSGLWVSHLWRRASAHAARRDAALPGSRGGDCRQRGRRLDPHWRRHHDHAVGWRAGEGAFHACDPCRVHKAPLLPPHLAPPWRTLTPWRRRSAPPPPCRGSSSPAPSPCCCPWRA